MRGDLVDRWTSIVAEGECAVCPCVARTTAGLCGGHPQATCDATVEEPTCTTACKWLGVHNPNTGRQTHSALTRLEGHGTIPDASEDSGCVPQGHLKLCEFFAPQPE